jgi:hypothetical protein
MVDERLASPFTFPVRSIHCQLFAGNSMMWLRLIGDERGVSLMPVANAVKVSLAT